MSRFRVGGSLIAAACWIAAALGSTTLGVEPAELDRLLKTFADEFVAITPGAGKFPAEFRMGDAEGAPNERPPHPVRLARAFAMAKYEVPQNLYEAVMGHNPSRWKGPRNSAEMFTWGDAVAFCRKATDLLRERKLLAADEEIRLPTEAEWEYCCRAGTTTRFSFGDEVRRADDPPRKNSILDEYGWYTGNAAGNDPPVGKLKPNPWGLYDMHGYLWEFTSDRASDDYQHAPRDGGPNPPTAPDQAVVVRGGSWKDPVPQLRSAARRFVSQQTADDAIGFRCVRAQVRPAE